MPSNSMKRVPVLSVVLTLAILAGFLLLFPVEWVGLLVLLLGLIVFQTVLVRRHLQLIGSARDFRARRAAAAAPEEEQAGAGAAKGETGAGAASSTSGQEASESPESEAPPEGTGEGADRTSPFDPEIFSRFRAHLETAEQAGGDLPAPGTPSPGEEPPPEETGSTPARPETPPEEAEAAAAAHQADRVVISPAARRRAEEPERKAPEIPEGSAAAPERTGGTGPPQGEEDLFADLRPDPSGAAGRARPGAESKPPEPVPVRRKAAASGEDRAAAGGEDDLRAALATEEAPVPPSAEEGAMLLKMAEDALAQGNTAGAQAGLEQALALYEALPGGPPPRARLIQTRLAVLEGEYPAALDGFEKFLKENPELEEAQYLAPIEQVLAPLEGEAAASLKVSLLLKVLAALRQANDRRGMDRVYGLIEEAQELAGDERKLIQYYRNHLEIRKVLEDVEGQLALIDRIGNRYYKLGDTQAAREFYEQGLKLRSDQEAAGAEEG